MRSRFLTAAAFLLVGIQLQANTFIFAMPSGTTVTDPTTNITYNEDVKVEVSVQSANSLLVSIFNLQTDPLNDPQAINAVTFDFAASLSSMGAISYNSAAQQVTISSKTSYTLSKTTSSTNWYTGAKVDPNNSGLTFFELCDLGNTTIGCDAASQGGGWPKYSLVGGPNPSTGEYSSANGSLTTKSHNPLLFEEAQFTVTITNSIFNPEGTVSPVSNVYAGFGTGTGIGALVPYDTWETPEPTPLILMGTGIALIFVGRWRRRRPSRG